MHPISGNFGQEFAELRLEAKDGDAKARRFCVTAFNCTIGCAKLSPEKKNKNMTNDDSISSQVLLEFPYTYSFFEIEETDSTKI